VVESWKNGFMACDLHGENGSGEEGLVVCHGNDWGIGLVVQVGGLVEGARWEVHGGVCFGGLRVLWMMGFGFDLWFFSWYEGIGFRGVGVW